MTLHSKHLVTIFAASGGRRFLKAASTKRQRAITKQPGHNASL